MDFFNGYSRRLTPSKQELKDQKEATLSILLAFANFWSSKQEKIQISNLSLKMQVL